MALNLDTLGLSATVALFNRGDQLEGHIRNISLREHPDRYRHVLVVDDRRIDIEGTYQSPGGGDDINQWPSAQVDVIEESGLSGVIVGD